ncbi:MAG: hypothetical protein H6Q07_2562, partial [Acidobacteria bacterium]|nr:hypothetical protein [Acidobacteriota bacterium]
MKEGEETLEFCHPLIAEVIQGELSQALRRRMHRKIAEVLQREYGGEGRLQELAMHSMEGHAGTSAVRHALALASKSRAEFSHESALRCFQYVFSNRGDLTSDELCQAAIDASDTMFALGMPKRAIQILKSEMGKNRRIEGELKSRMLMQLAMSYQHLGDFRMQETCCRQGLRYFRNQPENQPNLTKAMLWAQLAFGAILQSQPRRGIRFLGSAVQSCPDPNSGALAGRIQNLAASLHRIVCSLDMALTASKKAADILSYCGESYLTCSAYSTLGI